MSRNITAKIITLLSIVLVSFSLTSRAEQFALIQTDIGNIHIVLYDKKAPVTVANFVRYVKSGHYNGGQFYRVVRDDNDHGQPIINVIQGGPNKQQKDFAPITLENTKQTGLRHQNGSLSMARGTPDSATSEFFICIGAQPSLDFGGKRNPDGLGFAVFGRVIKGMDIVKKIQQQKDTVNVTDTYVQGQILAHPINIIRVTLENRQAAPSATRP